MFMWAMYCVCMHTFHSAHICMVFNSVKCVHYFYLQVNSWIITYWLHCLSLQPILCIVHWTRIYIHWILDLKYILLLLVCVFRRVDGVCLCLLCTQLLFWVLCFVLSVVCCWSLCLMLVVETYSSMRLVMALLIGTDMTYHFSVDVPLII